MYIPIHVHVYTCHEKVYYTCHVHVYYTCHVHVYYTCHVHVYTLIALNMVVSLLQYCLIMWRVAMPNEHRPCKIGVENPAPHDIVTHYTTVP